MLEMTPSVTEAVPCQLTIGRILSKGVLPKQVELLEVKFVAALDRTSVGKMNEVALRQKHLPQEPGAQPRAEDTALAAPGAQAS